MTRSLLKDARSGKRLGATTRQRDKLCGCHGKGCPKASVKTLVSTLKCARLCESYPVRGAFPLNSRLSTLNSVEAHEVRVGIHPPLSVVYNIMKTAQEWIDSEQWHETGDKEILEQIKSIQKDAIFHAALLVYGISRGTKSQERAIAINEAIDLLVKEYESVA
jgi:hypothetical protein